MVKIKKILNCRVKTLDNRNIVSVFMSKTVLQNKSLQTNQTYKLHKIISYKVVISSERAFGITFNTTKIVQEVFIDL